jgi:hypothetical protein
MALRRPEAIAERWLRALPKLRGSGLRVAYLRAEVARRPLDAIAEALNDLVGRAEQADPLACEVLAAVAPLLEDPALAAWTEELRCAAVSRAFLPLGRLLRFERHTAASGDDAIDERTLMTSSTGRVLTLGERRALARRPSRATLDKLLRDPHPMVIRNLLTNPRITEDDVLRMAARRPAYADVLREIARHPVWSTRPRIRRAIVQNPGAPQEIAVPLLRLLIRPELTEVASAADVPAAVRAAAQELLERRPPVPERRDKGEPQ